MAVIPEITQIRTAVTAFEASRPANRAATDTGAPATKAATAGEAFRQFESFVLQSFIETMLPKNAEAVFGKGSAGAIWKSMLAEKLADQISRSGGIGIAQRIAATSGNRTQPMEHVTAPAAVSVPQTDTPRPANSDRQGEDA